MSTIHKFGGEAVELWVKDLEDIAQEADDVLDEIGYEVLRRKVELRNEMKKKVKIFFSHNNPIAFRFKMAHKIKKINKSLVNLNNEAAGRIGLVARTLANATSQDVAVLDRETVSDFIDIDEKFIIGREEVVSDIVKTSIKSNYNEENYLPVLAIVGMPGLGKTTLAKSIYHESEIDSHFDEKIWVCVSTPFEVKKILSGILEYFEPEKAAAAQRKEVICKFIREKLEKKRYLLVLDDVWSEDPEKWKQLRSCLLTVNYTQGSSIIVTTRSDKVAKVMETFRCDLRRLSDDESWLIMKDKAVSVGSAPMSKEQETTGKEIAKKCGGVPLMAKVLGDTLRSKTRDEWGSIVNSKVWDSPVGERIFSILKLSFDELKPPSLKQCFAYCSMLFKDFDIEKDDLIQLWMAQGLLHPCSDKNLEMEERGNEYFKILLAKSFFQDVTKDYGSNVTKCKMHDLVHDFAERVSKSGNLRSLFSNGEDLESNLLNLKSLRVLNLYNADTEVLPDSIGKLKHLRYLNVLKTRMKALPKSIGKLYNLQTLKMPNQLEEFPTEIANLTNLRHICFGRYMKVPGGILGRFTDLRSLPFLKVSKETGLRIEELSGLNQLHNTLSIYGLENVGDGEEAQKANLVEKKHIRKLILDWKLSGPNHNVENDDDVLEGLRPHSSLEFLEIHGFMGTKFPSWLLLANHLKEIELLGCNKCEGVPVLGHLPNLSCVKIKRMEKLTRIGSEFYGDNHVNCGNGSSREAWPLFPALKTLHIKEARNLIEWMEAPTERGSRVVFPCLEELTLIHCEQLISAPSHFPSLKKLVIEGSGGTPIASILSNQLTTLTYLSLRDVRGLTCLPEGMLENNKNLAHLDIHHCSELICISPQSQGSEYCCASLSYLDIWTCANLKYLPDGLLTPSLKKLKLSHCYDLKYIPDATHGGLTSLETLIVMDCSKITSIPFSQGLPSLGEFTISRCRELSSLPGGLEYCTSIRSLRITECPKVPSISVESLSTSLQELCVSNLDSLPISRGGFTSLREFTICFCRSAQFGPGFSAFLQTLVSLQKLTIWACHSLETIPSSDKLTSLRSLEISHCSKLTCLPDGLAASSQSCSLTRLKKLTLGGFCVELDAFPAFQAIPQLESLTIRGWRKLKSLPEQIPHLPSLRHLTIERFWEVEAIPEWLGNLASLEDLSIYFCKSLMYLPSVEAMRRLTKLKEIDIRYGCDLLEERCREESGPEWPKIRHLPFITIGDTKIVN
ncbi:putative disease resistance protein RGA4 isoform X1 [Rosa rugosa]|uniref:putative disease resistance protein RGA4 isoform X1 n=2 Tax=Rosa rugosa TaxID=74645 RepID=UPI002B40A7A2|nr:putative disease resistance protein RGA4 isoform X1 [Rosa rugosa]XP_062002746.1 putative disease resistance protein RGA4 isoform X1 [Rosa rugosa]XP_062002747.1 putative disease resistance protein RGA4 isoform X1 [Rosa rugosa]XP_062002748.1 putative disease resistance protein RGA4 isoform X1 [Rosa rugosa]XP_062002749.1 putative disease resistance protein RGA4 isoform X1 [Rosa rugosa]XP_062002750.1 putative disease resistance protein RGA4 isoform X1 [Rosa rugosa]XP_062002751.1 putative disea